MKKKKKIVDIEDISKLLYNIQRLAKRPRHKAKSTETVDPRRSVSGTT